MNTNAAIMVNGRPVDYSGLPYHMQYAMRRYIENGIEPGSFLSAVLCNDFMGAVGRAGYINRECLPDYAKWLYNNAPPAAFGSREKFIAWMEARLAPHR